MKIIDVEEERPPPTADNIRRFLMGQGMDADEAIRIATSERGLKLYLRGVGESRETPVAAAPSLTSQEKRKVLLDRGFPDEMVYEMNEVAVNFHFHHSERWAVASKSTISADEARRWLKRYAECLHGRRVRDGKLDPPTAWSMVESQLDTPVLPMLETQLRVTGLIEKFEQDTEFLFPR